MFQGLSTALTALYADRQALETTGNNIANANTEGYTRQRVEMVPGGGQLVQSFWATAPKVGTGVNVKDIIRLRDAFLESRGLTEHSTNGELTRTKVSMDLIEMTFGEPGENGLQAMLSQFWATWDDLANNPGDLAARSQIVEQAQTLVNGFQQASADLDKIAQSSVEKLKTDVTQLNTWAQNVADLNKAVQASMQAGTSPNALLDQRDLLISKMSDLASLVVTPTENGSVSVSIGGVPIVRDDRTLRMEVDDTGTPVVVRWDQDGDPVTVTDGFMGSVPSGEIKGLLEAINTLVPRYKTLIDDVATSIITTVNTQHLLGQDANGDPGIAFFTGTDAASMAVAAAIVADSQLVAAGDIGGGEMDGENARAMANLAELNAGPDALYRQLIDTLGVETQRATRRAEIQVDITNSVDEARQSTAGVNLDEEMTNMVRYQKSYSAAAKYLTVMDEVLESLLNII